MNENYSKLAHEILKKSSEKKSGRILVGIAGPPGCGKSTIAEHVVAKINESTKDAGVPVRKAQAVSLDGFHYTRQHLNTLPNHEEAYIRRGAPWTFDVEAIFGFIEKLRETAGKRAAERGEIFAPSFDHAIKDPIQRDVIIAPEVSIILLDGNYILLDEAKWRDIGKHLDFKIFVDVEPTLARERVAKRHVAAGIEPTLQKGEERFDANDAINGELIRQKRVAADIVVQSVHDP